jgi:hypothetical protein
MEKNIGEYKIVAPSKKKHKKYDVYKNDKYILSFGDLRYEHYHDKIGYYKNLNHGDKQRRSNYRKRHKNDHINDPDRAGYWSYWYLW